MRKAIIPYRLWLAYEEKRNTTPVEIVKPYMQLWLAYEEKRNTTGTTVTKVEL